MGRDESLTIDDVINKAKVYLEKDDTLFLHRAYEFAEKAHAGQYRKSGELYIIHPVQVAGILVDLQLFRDPFASRREYQQPEQVELYIINPVQVAGILVDLQLEQDLFASRREY